MVNEVGRFRVPIKAVRTDTTVTEFYSSVDYITLFTSNFDSTIA